MSGSTSRRVVITGMGVVSPLGLSLDDLWKGLVEGTSGVGPLDAFPTAGIPLHHAAEARGFTGEIDNFGPLDGERKKAIRKGCKVMCRESQMAVAAAQRALHDCGNAAAHHPPERFGCVFGSDYMLTLPEDFTASVAKCRGADGLFDFQLWAGEGMPQLTPLWLLKYLPNMPASHIAIYNDLRGPSNSLTLREASGHLAVGEAVVTIQRGAADIMVAGSTGTRVHPMKTVHALQSEQVATGSDDPTTWSRPFDKHRRGMVLGEGSAVLILEELSHAQARGARIYGEIIGHAARCSTHLAGVGRRRQAVAHALRRALEMAAVAADGIGHVHAHGASTVAGDRDEAEAMHDVLGSAAGRIPTVAAKSHFGNLGGGSGLVECVGSILALRQGELFPLLNHETADEECAIRPARRGDPAGDVFVSTSVTPQGQAGSLVVRSWRASA
ncbi:MAG: beta-ketoacyl-[acyl-carrier-protein] synthase family protein [Planctomycetia bacterium]|nr:beta-ketoacyl-[acyl-carrier-protein] synthase family protein [Planctomycetia bacterium]